MLKIGMFRRVKPRGFNYRPIHYDPVQEARQERRKELLGEDAASPLRDPKHEGAYSPGQYIRSGGIRRSHSGIASRHSEKRRSSFMRSGIALAILAAMSLWLLFGGRTALIFTGVMACLFFIAIRRTSRK